MSLHPEYLEIFLKTQHQLMRTDGALSLPERHYVAIMASARHNCLYLVSLHSSCFLQVGGDPHWLEGSSYAPLKLRRLNDLNKYLAHRPWLITKDDIESLLKSQGGNAWSLAELIHALVLLSHFHALSSFILGCGIYPPEDMEVMPRSPSPDIIVGQVSPLCTQGTSPSREAERVLAQIKKLDEEEQEESKEQMATRFELKNGDCALVTANAGDIDHSVYSSVLRFLDDPDFGYIDFSQEGVPGPAPFSANEYAWEDHGYCLLHRLYPEVGQLLDDKFQVAYNLTYNTIASHQQVNTFKLRRAIWNYIHFIYGVMHDDYNYSEMNNLLQESLKVYMKTVTCYPERLTLQLYNNFWRQFKHSEKVHLNILLLEARLQAALLYSLRAITYYMM